MRRRNESGLTLVEILLALLVFIVGIVGVMALFPTAMYTSRLAIEEQRGAILAESVKNALAQALRTIKTPAGAGTPPYVLFLHDFKRVNAAGSIIDQQIYGENNEFPLPLLTDGWRRHPGNFSPGATPSTLTDDQVFLLGGDGWLVGSSNYVRGANDPGENYAEWAFFFDVRKQNTMPWLSGADAEAKMNLYEFTIYVCRRRPDPANAGKFLDEVILRVSDRTALR